MNRHFSILFSLAFLSFLFLDSAVFSQTSDESLHDLALEDLMNVRVVSSTQESVALAEAPSTTFVVTGDQIRRSGSAQFDRVEIPVGRAKRSGRRPCSFDRETVRPGELTPRRC